jgi:ribonucleoside-diphosphate reductase alpha chain
MPSKRQNKLRFKYVFSDSKNHPYKQVDWDEYGVSRGYKLRNLIDQVVKKYLETVRADKYLATVKDLNIFERELTWLLLNQTLAVDSSVWLTVGRDGPQRVSSRSLIGLADGVEAKFNCLTNLACIVNRGASVGVNLSKLSSDREGRAAGGPVGFLQLAEALVGGGGGQIMFVLDIDHPDIVDFINHSYEPTGRGRPIGVRVSDDFMRAVEADAEFGLRARTTGEVIRTVNAAELFGKIARASWHHGGLSVQFDTTINAWQTVVAGGKITTSSPAAEFMSLDGLECPRASLDLLKFISRQRFDFEKFISAVEIAVVALDASIGFGDFSTADMADRTKKFRPIGLGFANLNAVLERLGLEPGSKTAQALAGAIASLLGAVAYRRSAELAAAVGADDHLKQNLPNQSRIVKKHYQASMRLTDAVVDELKSSVNINEVLFAANLEWDIALELGKQHGWRNCHLSALSPSDDSLILEYVEGVSTVAAKDQVELLASLQPYLSGGIGRSIHLSADATTDDIAELYKLAWRRGLKSLTIRRKVEYDDKQ